MRVLKITGGRMKGHLIRVDENLHARHTSSKVRESIFNMLGDIKDKKIIDLFSGSGILAFEAISRDVESATFVEIDKRAVKTIQENIDKLKIQKRCMVINRDVFEAIPLLYNEREVFDVIFMDPPYEKGFIATTLQVLEKNIIYNMDSVFVVESSKREVLNDNSKRNWYIIKQKRYGDTLITVLKSKLFN